MRRLLARFARLQETRLPRNSANLFCWACWVSAMLAAAMMILSLGGGGSRAQAVEVDVAKLPAASKSKVDFVKHVQPIFRRTCYSCHGPEDQEAGLRLDLRERALEGGDSGKVIVPGKSAESLLIHVVAGIDADDRQMPPEGEGTPLNQQQVALLRGWIDQGANWPKDADRAGVVSDHWAYQPIQSPAPPAVRDKAWPTNGIDNFVLARLEREGVAPSPAADRATLLRRVYLDLVGLAPDPQEAAEFLNDTRPDAYERLVDRLLRSPHYGERWGRHWLDLARYADSDGYEKDRPRPFAWRYRHWVIQSLNNDMPFDEFTIQQLAGDLLPKADIEARVATGFHRNTLHNTEGGTDKEEDRVKKTVDRTNTVGTVWLGTTIGCAQCHTHKYDPITQREYYSFYSFFNSIDESDIPAPLADETRRLGEAKKAHRQHQKELEKSIADYVRDQLPIAQTKWEQSAAGTKTSWQTIDIVATDSAKGTTLKPLPDKSVLASGKNEKADTYTLHAILGDAPVTAIRLEALPDRSLPGTGPGRSSKGNFTLTTLTGEFKPLEPGSQPINLEFSSTQADFSQKDWGVALAVNDKPDDGWAISPEFGKRHLAAFQLKAPLPPGGGKLTLKLEHNYTAEPHNLGRFRLSATSATGKLDLEDTPANIRQILATPASKRNKQQQQSLASYYRARDPQLMKLETALTTHTAKPPKLSENSKAQSVTEASRPRQAHVHLRGDFLSPGEAVPTKTPAVLPELKPRGKRLDRLDLARWLMDPSNPLTARVTVNRVWQRHFGRGIVTTSDDFGTQGEPPSHPQLLDWLASEFRHQNWSLKELHRLIVTSSTYKQSSDARSDLADRDPENIWLARQERQRMEAEIIRDLSLSASGLLAPKIGGPSVRPPQPAEYSKLTYANSARWTTSTGGDQYRRGLYTFFQRTSPYPMLMTFDAPDSTECTARRSTSNTPLQALTIWNDPVFFECAQALARRILCDAPAGADETAQLRNRIDHAFLTTLARRPTSEEQQTVVKLYQDQKTLCAAEPAAAATLAGKQPAPNGIQPDELAAWVLISRTMLNLDEFITRE